MNKHILHSLIFLFLPLLLAGCGLATQLKRADKKFAIGEYYDAAEIYRSCYRKIKDKELKGEVAFKQGECYRILNSQKAFNAYKNAITNRYHRTDSIVFLRQAQVLQYQGKYKEAIKSYESYLKGHPDCDIAQSGLFACKQIDAWKRSTTRYKVALAQEFNEKRWFNFCPMFVGEDDDVLMFTSNRTSAKKKFKKMSAVTGVPIHALYTTKKDASGKWSEPQKAEGLYAEEEENSNSSTDDASSTTDGNAQQQPKVDGTSDVGVCCFSADGKTMYFTYSKPINGVDQGTKIFVSERASGEWGEPHEVRLFRDSTISVAHPALSPSGDTLYFVSDAPGGYGGKDIWFAELSGSDWEATTNLGPKINTSGDEMFPYVRQNGTLYFASNGHPGYGGLDIFRVVRHDSTLLVMNMGYPFNSSGDDFGVTFASEGEKGFFSSSRNQRKGNDQIYSFLLPEMILEVEGRVLDNQGEPISGAIVRLVGTDGTNTKLVVKKDGSYRIRLSKNVRYAMLATARGYLNQKQELTTQGIKDSHTETIRFSLSPVSKPVTMNNIFYEFGKYTLSPQSEPGLKDLVKLLRDNPNITIELAAHTDMVGDSASNKTLSEKRAQSVVDYLIQHGVEADRLTPVGYGEARPVVVDAALHAKYDFLPIEQTLDEKFVLSLMKDHQEICNQINRRTEFKVLKTTYNLY